MSGVKFGPDEHLYPLWQLYDSQYYIQLVTGDSYDQWVIIGSLKGTNDTFPLFWALKTVKLKPSVKRPKIIEIMSFIRLDVSLVKS